MPNYSNINGVSQEAVDNAIAYPFRILELYMQPWYLGWLIILFVICAFIYLIYSRLGVGYVGRKFLP